MVAGNSLASDVATFTRNATNYTKPERSVVAKSRSLIVHFQSGENLMAKDVSEIPKPKSISGKRFKDILERLNISEVFLAERSGVSRNTIIKVRNNEPVRESSINKLCKTIGIRRSDIEENFEQEEEQEHVINGPRGWKIIEALTPTYTCDNGLEYRVVKLQSELIEQKIVRGKFYDLALVAPDARTAMREHLSRHATVCELGKFDRQRIACNFTVIPLKNDSGWWILDEWIEGTPLSAMLKASPLPLTRVKWIGSELLKALRSLHHANVIMRELTPEHVYVNNDKLKLTDFELAKLINGKRMSVQGSWDTPNPFRAPEVEDRSPKIQSDLFSWAAIMVHSLSGDLTAKSIPSLSDYPTIAQLLKKCLHRSFGQRPATTDEVLADWESWKP
ncbi:MAG: protein kinase [Pirellulaceae bacterium]|nr:protein kinase [Pirellulaceae bacterium]